MSISRSSVSPPPGAINVGQPDFFKAADNVFKTVSLDDWKTYLRWHLIHDTAPMLSKDFVDENFDFYRKTLTGAEKLKPRWKRVVNHDRQRDRRSSRQTLCRRSFPA